MVKFLVGFTNKGSQDFTVKSLEASFRYPQEFQFYVRNVRWLLRFTPEISTLDQFQLPVGVMVCVCRSGDLLCLMVISACSSQLYLWTPWCSPRLRPPSSTPSSPLSPWQGARLASSFSSTILILR